MVNSIDEAIEKGVYNCFNKLKIASDNYFVLYTLIKAGEKEEQLSNDELSRITGIKGEFLESSLEKLKEAGLVCKNKDGYYETTHKTTMTNQTLNSLINRRKQFPKELSTLNEISNELKSIIKIIDKRYK